MKGERPQASSPGEGPPGLSEQPSWARGMPWLPESREVQCSLCGQPDRDVSLTEMSATAASSRAASSCGPQGSPSSAPPTNALQCCRGSRGGWTSARRGGPFHGQGIQCSSLLLGAFQTNPQGSPRDEKITRTFSRPRKHHKRSEEAL